MPNGPTGNVVTHERREEICGDDSGNSRATSTCTPEAHRKRPSLLETRHRNYRLFLRRSSQRKCGEREPTPTPLCSSPAFLDKSIARLRAEKWPKYRKEGRCRVIRVCEGCMSTVQLLFLLFENALVLLVHCKRYSSHLHHVRRHVRP